MKAKILSAVVLLISTLSCTQGNSGSVKMTDILPIVLLGSDSNSSSEEVAQTPVDSSSSQTGSDESKTNSSNSVSITFSSPDPVAAFLFDTVAVNRYNNLSIRFSRSMDILSVEENLKLLDQHGNPVVDVNGDPGYNFYWDSPRDLFLDPKTELDAKVNYTVTITPDAKTTTGSSLKEFSGTFTTEYQMLMTHKIITATHTTGIDINKDSGVVINKTADPTLTLESTLSEPNEVASVKLCKLGYTDTVSGLTVCKAEVANGIELCSGTCTGTLSTNLSSSLITPDDGGNSYFYQVESKSGKKYFFSVNFNYGTLADPDADATDAAKVFLDRQLNPANANKSVIQAVSNLIKSYGKAEFTLGGQSLNQFVTGDTANTPPATDLGGQPCMSWGSKPAFTYLSKVGPFCNIQVSGSIFVSSTYPSVKYAAMADVYITDVAIDEVAMPGNVDNVSINLSPENGYVEIYLNGKKASGKMTLVAKLPDTAIKTGDLSTGSTQVYSVANAATDLIVGMVVTGTGIPAGTTVAAISGTTVTLSNPATAPGSGVSLKFEGIEFFTYLVGDTFIFTGSSDSNYNGDAVSFSLNNDPPSLTDRLARARTTVAVDTTPGPTFGNIQLAVSPANFSPSVPTTLGSVTFNKCGVTFNPAECNPLTNEWSDNIATGAVVGSGAVAAIIADVVNQKIEEVKPRVVQGVVQDITERVAPDIVNNIVGQLKNGVTVALPDYLPPPLNKVTMTIRATLNSAASINDTINAGIEASANASISACVKDAADRCPGDVGYSYTNVPPTLRGEDKYVVTKGSSVLPSIANRSATNPGALVALHADTINQAFYHLWNKGAINLNIDKDFIDSINGFAGTSSLLKLTESLLKTDPITTVFAPGRTTLQSGGDTIYSNDDVVLKVNPILLPFVGVVPLSGTPGQSETPKISLNLSDLGIDVYGRKTDTNRLKILSADFTSGSNTITVVATTGLNKGMSVCGNGIPAGTEVSAASGTTVTLDNATTSTLTGESIQFVDGGRYYNASLVAGTSSVTVSDSCGLETGMLISGNGIPADTTITGIAGTTLTLSNAITTTGSTVRIYVYKEYLIAKVMVTLKTVAELGFGTYSLPATTPDDFNPSSSLLASVGKTSIQLNISDAPGDLYYILEPLEGVANNPLGLNPDGIWEVMDPLVKSLVLPLLNNITKDIPLPALQSCGLELKNLKILDIPATTTPPYMLLNAEVENYTFTGNCQL
ncbi:MAG: Ig-like domain-containing protein [Spirochaetota bacterium]